MKKISKVLKDATIQESIKTDVFGKVIAAVKKFSSVYPDTKLSLTPVMTKQWYNSLVAQSDVDDMTFFNVTVWTGGTGDSLTSVNSVQFNYVIDCDMIDNVSTLNSTRIAILDVLYNLCVKDAKEKWKEKTDAWVAKFKDKQYYCFTYKAHNKDWEGDVQKAVEKSIGRNRLKLVSR